MMEDAELIALAIAAKEEACDLYDDLFKYFDGRPSAVMLAFGMHILFANYEMLEDSDDPQLARFAMLEDIKRGVKLMEQELIMEHKPANRTQ